ncbi:hypothetical protein ColKHC_13092 [Colletotrichum higginsianum]|nr:hypothetical protein ColKHC_13092 [Colletotrichum higginsianum]
MLQQKVPSRLFQNHLVLGHELHVHDLWRAGPVLGVLGLLVADDGLPQAGRGAVGPGRGGLLDQELRLARPLEGDEVGGRLGDGAPGGQEAVVLQDDVLVGRAQRLGDVLALLLGQHDAAEAGHGVNGESRRVDRLVGAADAVAVLVDVDHVGHLEHTKVDAVRVDPERVWSDGIFTGREVSHLRVS